MSWFFRALIQYAVFSGRARRKEYWFFQLFIILIGLCCVGLDVAMGTYPREPGGYGPVTTIFTLLIFLPNLAVTVRRLHDTNRSGWWILIGLLPFLGFLVLLVFTVEPGSEGENDYGPDPLD